MFLLVALRWLPRILALAVCSLVVVAFATPASARPHHRSGHHAHGHHHKHHHYAHRHHHHHRNHYTSRSDTNETGFSGGGFGSNVVSEARRYIGGNPTGRSRLWCARFMNMVLNRSGHKGTGSDMASSFAHYGRRVSGPEVGAIAVMGRRGGGHVGVVSGIDRRGNPIIVSGNHGHRVAESVYPRGRIYAYVVPN